MALISVENLSKSYGMKTLFDQINIHIEQGDRIGIVGINGTGKSTLLKIIAGLEGPDSGQVTMPKKTSIAYLTQTPIFDEDATILEQVLKGDSPVFATLRDYEAALEQAHLHPNDKAIHDKLMRLTDAMTQADAWELESQVKTILTKLSVHDFDKKVTTLSGGQKKRVALAAALSAPCDLLILDEPTNHMDNATIDWLEGYLKQQRSALLMVTHDRYFLDRVCNRIVELDHGKAYSYEGNYTVYVDKKVARIELSGVLEQRRQNLFKRELAWIRTGARARSTKQKARIQRFEELKELDFSADQSQVEVSVGFTRLGKKTVVLDHIAKGFDGVTLFKDLEYTLLSNDRLGIIGPNGTGKSTLLNLIVGRLTPDAGNIEIGDTVKIGYFSQEATEMNLNLKSIDYIKETAEYIPTATGYQLSASQMLERFLFTGEMQHAPIHSLSGGERRRLYLLKILMEAPNLLILDEPTNDLDIDTLKVLESYIDDFKGIVISVSHDRYFLDRICTTILSFEPQGIVIHTGNYEDYKEYAALLPSEPLTSDKVALQEESSPSRSGSQKKPREKLSYKEQQDLENLGPDIEKLMQKLDKLQHELGLHQTDFVKLQEITDTIEATELELLEKMERLETLEEKRNQLTSS